MPAVHERAPVFKIVVLALVTFDATVGVFFGGLFVQAAEHTTGVAALVDELEFEGEDEVAVFFFGAKKGVRFEVFAEAADGIALHFVLGVAASGAPAGEVFAVEEVGEAVLLESAAVDDLGEAGWKETAKSAFAVVISQTIPREFTFLSSRWDDLLLRFLRFGDEGSGEEEGIQDDFHDFGRKKPFCLSEMARPSFSITTSMSSQILRFSVRASLSSKRRKEG